jgi:hypothetical protein
VFLPVDQLSVSVQPLPNVAVSAYYQFEWRGSRLPGIGSYFSDTDVLGAGAERFLLTQEQYLHHGNDRTPPAGQFGVSLRTTLDDVDFGFYGLRYDSKYPMLRFTTASPAASSPNDVGEFYSVYPGGVELYGFSFSGYLRGSNVAGEFSARLNAPVIGASAIQDYPPTQAGNLASSSYARGNTLHAQLSSVTTLPPSGAWDSANVGAELSATDLLDLTQNQSAVDIYKPRFASSLRVRFEPHYFHVLPNLDITLPLGFGYGLAGQSGMYFGPNSGAGDFEIGISGTYRSVWKADLLFTSFLGTPYHQPLADRDFVLFSVERTF